MLFAVQQSGEEVLQTQGASDAGARLGDGHGQSHGTPESAGARIHPGDTPQGLPLPGTNRGREEHVVPGAPEQNLHAKEAV